MWRTAFSDGLTVTLRRSKPDQEGAGRSVGIPYGSNPATCPARTLQSWLEAAAITEDAGFRSINRHGQLQPARALRDGRRADGEEAWPIAQDWIRRNTPATRYAQAMPPKARRTWIGPV